MFKQIFSIPGTILDTVHNFGFNRDLQKVTGLNQSMTRLEKNGEPKTVKVPSLTAGIVCFELAYIQEQLKEKDAALFLGQLFDIVNGDGEKRVVYKHWKKRLFQAHSDRIIYLNQFMQSDNQAEINLVLSRVLKKVGDECRLVDPVGKVFRPLPWLPAQKWTFAELRKLAKRSIRSWLSTDTIAKIDYSPLSAISR